MSVKSFFAAMTLKVKIIIVCSAVAVTSAAAVAVGVAVTKEDTYRVLKVFEMTGSAVVDRGGSGTLDAYVGMNLESGDTLTVGDDSTLRISMDSDKYVLLDSGTILELVASGTPSDSRTAINLKKGSILNEITNPLSSNSSYEVTTPKATMAVRGTSFAVSVEEDSIGGFIIREDTFNGKVEVTLLDTEGNPKDETALVPEDKGVTIRTERNKKSGNPAEVDGISRFVFEDENGVISELGNGDDPIRDIRYDMVSATIKEHALRSNDESLMILDNNVVAKLRGEAPETSESEIHTTAPVSEPVSEPETSPVQTTVPKLPVDTVENTRIAASQTEISNANSVTEPPVVSESETASTEVTSVTEAPEETETSVTSSEETVTSESSETSVKTETETSLSIETTVTTLPETSVVTPYTGQTGSSPSAAPASPEKGVFNVKFMSGETLVSVVSVKYGETVSKIPEIPEKNGYTAKWIYKGVEFTSETKVTSDMTVTAEYTIISYTITLTSEADTSYSKTLTADYGTLLSEILPDVPEVTGYTGVWKIGGTVSVTSSYKVTADVAVKAVYTINTYTVNITAEGDTAYSDTKTVDYGTLLAGLLPDEIPEKMGHDGVWKVNGEEYTPDYVITGNTDVTAVYTPKTYIVKFLNADGSLYDTREAEYNTTVTDIPDIQKDGYIIKWIYNGAEFTSDVKITENIEVTAEETEAVTLTFNYVTKDPEEIIIPKGTSLQDNGYELPEPDANKYFTGRWSAYITVDWPFDVDTSFDVIESAITYYFEFYDTDGTTSLSPKYLTYVDQISTVAPDVNGVKADSWLIYSEDGLSSRTITDADTVAKLVDEFGFDEASVIKVVAVMNERTLTWYDESGTEHNSSVLKGANLREKLDSLHTLLAGYFWAGSDMETPIADDLTITEDNTVAYAVLNKYTVTFFDEDGTTLLYTRTVDHGSTISEFPAVPDKPGSSGKWKCNGTEVTAATVVTGEMKVTAEYTAKTAVTITFTTNGSDTYATETAYIGDEYVFPEFDQNAFVNVVGMMTGTFEGYEYDGTIYQAGDTYVISGSMTLTPTFGW